MKNLFLLLLVAAGLIFGGKLYIEHRYEKQLDEAIALAGAMVPMRYDRVELGLDGSLSLHGFVITPPEVRDPISFGTITVSSSDQFAAIKGAKTFEGGRFPDAFSIKVQNVGFSSDLIKLAPKKERCRRFETSFAYSEIGIDSVIADASMSFDFRDPYNSVLDIYYSDDIGELNLEWVFDAGSMTRAFQGEIEPEIRELVFAAELNEDVAQSLAEYCGGLFNISAEDYLTKVVGSPKYSINSFDADLGQEFRDALTKFMTGGSQLTLRSKPSKQLLDFENAQFFKKKDVVRWLNLSITSDGKTIPVMVAEEKKIEATETATNADEENASEYVTVSLREAAGYVNEYVRVNRTRDRKAIKGRLLNVEGNVLSVEVYRYTGVMTLTIPASDVAAFEVYLKRS